MTAASVSSPGPDTVRCGRRGPGGAPGDAAEEAERGESAGGPWSMRPVSASPQRSLSAGNVHSLLEEMSPKSLAEVSSSSRVT